MPAELPSIRSSVCVRQPESKAAEPPQASTNATSRRCASSSERLACFSRGARVRTAAFRTIVLAPRARDPSEIRGKIRSKPLRPATAAAPTILPGCQLKLRA